jgi:hypothetical protein
MKGLFYMPKRINVIFEPKRSRREMNPGEKDLLWACSVRQLGEMPAVTDWVA